GWLQRSVICGKKCWLTSRSWKMSASSGALIVRWLSTMGVVEPGQGYMSIAEGRRHLEQLAPYTRYWRAGLPQRRSRNSTPDRGSAQLGSSWAGHTIDRRAERAPAPLLGSLQLVHATGQISYLLIQGHHPSIRNDAFQRHHERAEPTRDRQTAGCRSRSNKKHQRGK